MGRPNIFVGSSEKANAVGEAIAFHLAHIAQINHWKFTFPNNNSNLESLLHQTTCNEFAVLAMTGDDIVCRGAETRLAPRDNLCFEFGLFMGCLGREKTFAVCQRNIEIPSDLSGITMPRFDWPGDGGDVRSALKPACDIVAGHIRNFGPTRVSLRGFFGEDCLADDYPAVFWNAIPPRIDKEFSNVHFPELSTDLRGLKPRPLPKGVGPIIPVKEAQALLDLVKLFHQFGGHVKIKVDRYANNDDLPRHGCLSVGLGFSNLTRKLGQRSGLYQVNFNERIDGRPTDNFHIIDEKADRIFPTPQFDEEYGLIARILVPGRHNKLTPYLVCAGHTAPGTTAACRYLCDNWFQIWENHEQKLRDHHMVCIVYHKNRETMPERTSKLYFKPVDQTSRTDELRKAASS